MHEWKLVYCIIIHFSLLQNKAAENNKRKEYYTKTIHHYTGGKEQLAIPSKYYSQRQEIGGSLSYGGFISLHCYCFIVHLISNINETKKKTTKNIVEAKTKSAIS